jgi:OFA family oxalate/formate antiporter-like MFS transporter
MARAWRSSDPVPTEADSGPGLATTFQILGAIFLVMTLIGAFLLKNPPAGYKPAGWTPEANAKSGATTHEFSPGECCARLPST